MKKALVRQGFFVLIRIRMIVNTNKTKIQFYPFSIHLWLILILLFVTGNCSAQDSSNSIQPTFKRVNIDYSKVGGVFNQDFIVKTQMKSETEIIPLPDFPHARRFRRTRILSIPKLIDRGFKIVQGDTIYLKPTSKVDRLRGRLICATDSGVWLYQIAQKQVVYFPYSQIQHIRSGSSGWRATCIAIIPVAATMGGWLFYESVVAVTADQSMILFLSWFGFTTVDLMFWFDYSDRASSSFLCSSTINRNKENGKNFKFMAEGNRIQPPYNIFDILIGRELHFWPRTRIFKTSIPFYCLPETSNK